MTPTLRDYQIRLEDDAREAMRVHRRVLMRAPCGAGKGVMLASIAAKAQAKQKRIYILVHRRELVDQLSRALRSFDVRHGRIQPDWPQSDWPVQVGMIPTMARRLAKYPTPDLLFIDESHHAVAASYQSVIEHWPNVRVLGVTATPLRLDGRGLGRAFDHMVVGPSERDLIDAGWLADFDYLAPPSSLDFSHISIRAGDYAIDELAAATDRPTITGDVVAHIRQYLDRQPVIAFGVRVDHAEHIAAEARAAGIKAASVDGSMPATERDARIAGLGNGNTELLTSCELIGEGLDVPAVAGVVLLRRTKSLAMFIQMVGRAMRPKPDNSRAVILDHVGCVHEHGMPDAPRKWTLDDKKRRDPAPSVQTCEKCYRVFAGGAGWREGQSCMRDTPPGCILVPDEIPAAAEWKPPEVVAGQLQKFTTQPDWAHGIDILRAQGPEYTAMLEHADTYAKLDEIRRARGYSPFWVRHVLKSRRERQWA